MLKPPAATPALMPHTGRAVVFEDIDDYKARIGDDRLDVDERCVLVLKNCGPRGYPGMAEVGNMGLPPKVLAKGVTDMVRISDARMSGTAYGTVVLHVAPEAAVAGPLALVNDGDQITLDVAGRRLELHVDAPGLARRKLAWKPPVSVARPTLRSIRARGGSRRKSRSPSITTRRSRWMCRSANRCTAGVTGSCGPIPLNTGRTVRDSYTSM